jgi:hypothetical protein
VVEVVEEVLLVVDVEVDVRDVDVDVEVREVDVDDEVELLVDVLDVDGVELELVEVVEEVLLVVDLDVDDVLDVDVDEVVVVGLVHAPKFPTCPALFCGVGQRSAKSVALSSVWAMRVSENVPLPGASGVGAPDPVCVGPV